MSYNPNVHHRRSIRLKGYDYTTPGVYFVTLCTYQRQCLFGDIVNGIMELNSTGLLVQACWQRLSSHFLQLTLDTFVVMLNHLHGILCLGGVMAVPTHHPSNSPINEAGTKSGSIAAITQNFKSISTRRFNQIQGNTGRTLWQRNYYEQIIWDESALQSIRRYIQENPKKMVSR